ncbi:cytochrome c-type biogenesis protein [Vibrio maerlii]|uniref:cytochrome c-type biogenesis protein n=1 Tax=Vibrio maerlii TaxID=2231648 RepID=UPI000E3ED070|nr:cytochrome c-type biogenesis protein [Vibrio maerlii]
MINRFRLLHSIVLLFVAVSFSLATQANDEFFAPATTEQVVDVELFEFDSPQQQQRAIALAKTLRCPQCQNQNLVESNSPIAKDLRLIVFQQIKQGASDEQVKEYMVARFGEFVLYKPTFNGKNLVLWGLPILILVVFFALSFRSIQRKR